MFAHERSLVEKYQGRPFVLLGVDEDEDREALQEAQKQHKLNWRSWWDEGKVIMGRWSVTGLPQLYLIDHKGVIRYEIPGAPPDTKPMDEMIEKLVKEAESDVAKVASRKR
jgi:peroxiredoxin